MKKIHYRSYIAAKRYLAARGFSMYCYLSDKKDNVEYQGWDSGAVILRWDKSDDSARIIYKPGSIPILS